MLIETPAGRAGSDPIVIARTSWSIWDYDADRVDGFDYDIGAVLVRATTVRGEAELAVALQAWALRPEQFRHSWQTDDPK